MAISSSRNKIHRILVRLRLSYASARDILYGISRYAQKNLHWDIKLIPGKDTTPLPTYPNIGEVNGIITTDPFERAESDSACKIPLVVIGTRENWLGRRMKNLTFVRNDDRGIGWRGADYLLHLGRFRSFGFVPTNVPCFCSILRSEGFQSRLVETRSNMLSYCENSLDDGSEEDIAALGAWLKGLPKPAAIMAIHDLRATHVIEAARRVGIKIPSQLAVIGVDNDELLCDLIKPQLTSISPDHVKIGEMAAAALEKLLRDKKQHEITTTVKSKAMTIVERESATPIAPGVHLAETAMTFIRKNALKGIMAKDVAAQLKVSRRLLDMRFRECYGRSILETIISIRINEAKKRLTSSTTHINKITSACGFPNANTAQTLFKKSTGMTMGQWRNTSTS